MKIVIAEKVSPATVAVLRAEPGWVVVTHDQIDSVAGGLTSVLPDTDALIVRSAVQVDDALLAHAPKLRVIGRAGVGVDNIDAEAATRRGIVVMNTPGANAVAVAELTLALMLALARELPRANAALHAGRWEKKSLAGSELRGKTLGILGLGRIGLEVARRARAFGMTLVGHDPFVTAAVAREHEVRLVPVEELFRVSDYLSLHVGLTPQTHGIVNSQTLALMKPGARIINCARGELIDTAALAAALAAGTIAGAALDVFEQEPLKDSPFFGMERVLLTPHIAGSTTEAQEAVGIQIAEQVRAYLKLGVIQNAVNSPSLTHEQFLLLAPFATAAERLGAMLAQLLPSGAAGLESVMLRYEGALAEAQTEMVRNAALAGVLGQSESGHQGEGANRINAAQLAGERGVRVHEEHQPGGGSMLALTLHMPNGAVVAARAGASGSAGVARLLELQGTAIEAPLAGTLLVIRNSDVPGVIGRLGTVIGEHGINIANFALGRADGDGSPAGARMALAVIQIDGQGAPPLLDQLRNVEAVHTVQLVVLPA